MSGSPTYLDFAFLAIAAISGLLAMYRGLSREVLSITSWAAAAAAAAYFAIYQKPMAEQMSQQLGINNVLIAQVAGGALIFLVVLIFVHVVTSRISDFVLDSRVGMIDRILGFGFGVARAFVLLLVPYMVFAAAVEKPEQHPEWVRNSWSVGMIKPVSEPLSVYLKQRVETLYTKKSERTQ